MLTRAYVQYEPLNKSFGPPATHQKTYKHSIFRTELGSHLHIYKPIPRVIWFTKPDSTLRPSLFSQINMSSTTTEFVDYYAVLELPSTASIGEIRRTVRQKLDALLDVESEDSAAVRDQCLLLHEIEDILGDESRRSKYDADYQASMGS